VNKKNDPYAYPEGKARFEPIGVIIFSSIMGMSSLQILIEGAKRLFSGITGEPFEVELDFLTIAALSFTIISKFFLMIYCTAVYKRTNNSSVAAYAQDHMNDVMTNIVGVFAVVLAAYVPACWWADPIGAIAIASWIILSWGQTGSEHISMLAGRSAPQEFLRELTHIAYNHSPLITHIDTVRAYYFGTKFLVEVDIVLPEDMPLRQAHDIGEGLQLKLEGLEEVERAFVHSDFEWEHNPAGEHPGHLNN
jgi:cation diffusion facilitator family transporter